MSAVDLRAHAGAYAEAGWVHLRVEPPRTGDDKSGKRPLGFRWQDSRPTPADYLDGENIGVLLGAASGDLADIDLDCEEAVFLAPWFLPATGAIFGRAGAPRSHWLYSTEPAATAKWKDPTRKAGEKQTLVELRSSSATSAAQTVIPPSVHFTGEVITWSETSGLARVPRSDLERAVRRLAAASLLARHWQEPRAHCSLALCGALARAGWSDDEIVGFVAAVSACANRSGDERERTGEPEKRSRHLAEARARLENEEPTLGLPGLIRLGVPEKVVANVRPWLDLPINGATEEERRGISDGLGVSLVTTLPPQPNPEPGTWAHAFSTAHSDVQRALGTGADNGDRYREPLFEAAIELFRREYPATPWLVQGLITERGVGAVSTEPKSGKTWLGTEIAVAVATGTPVCGEFLTGPARHVGYLYAEDLAPQVRNRLRALGASRGLTPEQVCEHLHVQPRGKFLDLTKDGDLAWVVASCRRMPQLALLVLDPLRDLHSGEEDKSDSMREVARRLRVLSDLLGCSVLFIHHATKASADSSKRRGGQRMRGSSAIHGAVDFGLYLSGLTGDGQQVFTNHVESEVKGARGGGIFQLTLTIQDNVMGEALKAVWTVERPEAAKRATEANHADDDALLAAVAQNAAGAHEGWENVWRLVRLPDGKNIPQGRALEARARLLASPARIELDPVYTGGRRQVYKPVGVASR